MQMVPPGSIIADIGTDHAHLPIYLIKEGICCKAIATEVNIGPYDRAAANLKRAGIENMVDLRLGAGFSPLVPGEAQVAVVAGMGGEVIADIIMDQRLVAQTFDIMILQPMTRIRHLRKELFTLGYKIIDEDIAQEGRRFYEIIAVKKGRVNIFDSSDIVVGPVLRHRREPQIIRYFEHRSYKLERMIHQVERKETPSCLKALGEYKKELKLLREVMI